LREQQARRKEKAMKIEKFPLGILGANCYLLINEETKDTVVVDPGGHSKKFTAYIEEEKLNLVAILLTHGHFDHIMGIDSILENWNIPVYVEEEDLPIMTDPELNLSSSYTNGYSFDGAKPLKDGQKLELAGETIEVIHTPGHTMGGCCYYFPYEDVIFTGDSLFCGSIGRTDFKGGSMSDLVRTVKEKIMTLPEHTEVYPGHNDTTTIENERMYNPYL